MANTKEQTNTKRMKGTVVATDMDKTVRVKVGQFRKHPKYLKYVRKENQFLVHDEEEEAEVGDSVVIEETTPISKKKAFRVVSIDKN
jgi:small subunit ribosomal protein S17